MGCFSSKSKQIQLLGELSLKLEAYVMDLFHFLKILQNPSVRSRSKWSTRSSHIHPGYGWNSLSNFHRLGLHSSFFLSKRFWKC